MRIDRRDKPKDKKETVAHEIDRARELGPVLDPVCDVNCTEMGASGCHRDCEHASVRLTSDPEYPVENLVTPLVFEMKRLGVFHPCWSCEGHKNPTGDLWKIPRVWFYSDSVVHVRALSLAVNQMYLTRDLSTRWSVTVTHSDTDNPDTTFSLEPAGELAEMALAKLQGDLKVISSRLETEFGSACDELSVNAG